jgi:outer membrane protein assembly factor BamB/tetratricopeptide (TPR) repeat protein
MMRKSKSPRTFQQSSRRIVSRTALLAATLVLAGGSLGHAQNNDDAAQRALQQRQLELQQRIMQRQIARGNIVIAGAAGQADVDPQTTGVFVRDSAVAGEKLALAERMERLKEWDTSAEVYQEVLDQYADRVLPTHNDEKGQPDRFGSVTSVVQDRLAAWPEEGRAVYLARYELPARRLLESSDPSNRADLMKVVNRYFITAAGRDAAILLIESYFDHAEFIAAAALSDRLLEKHPQVQDQAPLLLTRSALSWHLAGEKERADLHAAELAKRFGEATDIIGGKPRNLSEIVSSALATPRQLRATSPGGWPVPFGSNDHTALASETVETGSPRIWAKLESIPLQPLTRVSSGPNDAEAEMQQVFRSQREKGAATGILPSVDGNQMFFQDNARIYSYDLDRGAPLLGWLASYPGQGSFFHPGSVPTPRGVQMTTTLTDRFVLAILGQPEPSNFGGMDLPTGVFCLDRVTGKVVWKVALSGLATEDETLRSARPAGSVIVAGDSVYVVARNRRPGAFEDSYLCCFALEDGSLRWARHLASGNSTRMYVDYNLPPQNSGDSHLAYADGSIFVSTDMGAIARVNAADGTLAWLSVYPRPLPQSPQNQWAAMNMGTGLRVTPAFVGNPVIVENGLIISLPGDAESLFVHDAATGELRGSVAMERLPSDTSGGDQSEKFEVLVGLTEGRVVLAGTRSIALLDLSKIVGTKGFADVVLQYRPFVKSDYREDTIRGRPFITNKSIYVPTAWKLFRLAADGSRALEMYPPAAQDTWDLRPDEKPGNVIYANDSLIVAGPDQINVYSDLSLLRKRMESAVAAETRSIHPRLRYADALFNAGQTDDAIKWVDSSIQQLTSNGLISPGPDRDRVFEMLMAMFRRLSAQERTEGTLAGLLERGGVTADTPMQQLTLQLSRAHLAKRTNDFQGAVEAFQRLIDDPVIGTIRLRSDEGAITASDFAVTQIGQILKANGSGPYDQIEARAQAALAAAQAANDPSKLLGVLAAFPNSQAGQDGVGLAMKATTAGGAASIDLLRRVGATPTDPTQKLPLYQSLLRAEIKRGDVYSALGRARMIARLEPNLALGEMPSLGGQAVSPSSPAELVVTLQSLAYEAEDRALPNLNAPEAEPLLDNDQAVHVKGVRTLLVPSNPRNDRVVTLAPDRKSIRIFEPGKATPIQTLATPETADSAQSMWRGDSLLVFVSQRVNSFDTKTGRMVWSFEPGDLKPISASEMALMSLDERGLIAPVVPQNKRQQIVMNPTIRRPGQVINRLNQQQVVRQMVNGEQMGVWEADENVQQPRETIAYTRVAGERVIIITTSGRVIGLDAANGSVRWQSNFSDRPPSMVAVYDDLVVLGGNNETSSTLSVYRAADGSQVINQTYSGAMTRRLNTVGVSREGYLAAVHNDFIDVFDLGSGDASPIATFDGQGQSLFAATRSQDQVQFCGGKLLVMINDAGRPQQVRMYDATTLEPVTVLDEKTRLQVDRTFTPSFTDGLKPSDPTARMYIQKDRMLLRAGRDFSVFRVPVPDAASWSRPRDPSPDKGVMSSQSPIFVRDGILIFDWPEKQLAQPVPSPQVQYFRRDLLPDGRESGTLVAEFDLSRRDAKMYDRVQVVDGGIYTMWTDNVLSFYPARKEK